MSKVSLKSSNHLIIDLFEQLLKLVEAEYLISRLNNDQKEITKNKFRLSSNKRILSILKSLDFEITNVEQLNGIYGIGADTKKRIHEILKTGKLAELDILNNNTTDSNKADVKNILELEQVIGIGVATAKKLVLDHNITSIKQLKSAVKSGKIKLNNNILLGLKYYGVVQGKIPRNEIKVIESWLKKQAKIIDPYLNLVICGSYRRGRATSGDIDVLIYHPNVPDMEHIVQYKKYNTKPYLKILIDKLTNLKFLLDNMTDVDPSTKYMGFCKFKNYPVRRIDILYMPYNSISSAMLYYTGPYELNTIMRHNAKKRNMILNQYGLYKIDNKGEKHIVPTPTEQSIFEYLGMEYMTPRERESFNTGKKVGTK